jgi:hypothetical protein
MPLDAQRYFRRGFGIGGDAFPSCAARDCIGGDADPLRTASVCIDGDAVPSRVADFCIDARVFR